MNFYEEEKLKMYLKAPELYFYNRKRNSLYLLFPKKLRRKNKIKLQEKIRNELCNK